METDFGIPSLQRHSIVGENIAFLKKEQLSRYTDPILMK